MKSVVNNKDEVTEKIVPIEGYDGEYYISNKGRIYSMKRKQGNGRIKTKYQR